MQSPVRVQMKDWLTSAEICRNPYLIWAWRSFSWRSVALPPMHPPLLALGPLKLPALVSMCEAVVSHEDFAEIH